MYTKTFQPVTPGSSIQAPQLSHQSSIKKNIPLHFIPNRGQSKVPSLYYSRGSQYAVHFNKSEVFFAFVKSARTLSPLGPNASKNSLLQDKKAGSTISWDTANTSQDSANKQDLGLVLALRFIGANPNASVKAECENAGRVSFFYGNDPNRWVTGIPIYQEVHYRDLWPGVDLFFKGNNGQLKYEFIAKPGADIYNIRLGYGGADDIKLDELGNMVIETAIGNITDAAPVCFQMINGQKVDIAGKYILEKTENGDYVYSFEMSEDYDRSYALIIDPGLDYSTYLGGTNDDQGYDIEVDDEGNAYVTGRTFSADFPITPGVYQPTANTGYDAFVSKLNPSGSDLVWSSFLGGSADDWGYGVALDDDGNVYVAGMTDSDDFPKTPGTIGTIGGAYSIFVTKFTPAGDALVWSCFGGGSGEDYAYHVDVDSEQNVYITGETTSTDMPTTPGAPQPTLGGICDAFVSKINSTATAVIYCSYLGGSQEDYGRCIHIDDEDSAYIVGFTGSSDFPVTSGAYQTTYGGDHDGFITKINPEGTAWVYSTYLGGSAHDDLYYCHLNADRTICVCGRSNSNDYPTTAGVYQSAHLAYYDAVVSKLSADGSSLVWSTFIGGAFGDESAQGIEVDADGNVIITGPTNSLDFPVTADALQSSYAGDTDVFLAKFNSTVTSLIYSTFLGGTDSDIAGCLTIDSSGNAYITGYTFSDDFPVSPGAFQTTFAGFPGFPDAFVTKFDLQPPPPPSGGVFRLVRYVINTTDDFPDDAQQFDADFFLVPDDRKVIHGTVRFPDGTPAPAAVVKFFKMLDPLDDPETTCDIESIGHAITDDCGQFLLGPLPADVNVIIKIFFLQNASAMGTPIPYIGTATPIDP